MNLTINEENMVDVDSITASLDSLTDLSLKLN